VGVIRNILHSHLCYYRISTQTWQKPHKPLSPFHANKYNWKKFKLRNCTSRHNCIPHWWRFQPCSTYKLQEHVTKYNTCLKTIFRVPGNNPIHLIFCTFDTRSHTQSFIHLYSITGCDNTARQCCKPLLLVQLYPCSQVEWAAVMCFIYPTAGQMFVVWWYLMPATQLHTLNYIRHILISVTHIPSLNGLDSTWVNCVKPTVLVSFIQELKFSIYHNKNFWCCKMWSNKFKIILYANEYSLPTGIIL
jgi:hypothetical protein